MPFNNPKRISLLLLFLLSALSISVWTEQRLNKNKPEQLHAAYKSLQRTIHDKQLVFLQTWQQELSDTMSLDRKWSTLHDIARKRNISVYVYQGEELKLWSDNLNQVKPVDSPKDTLLMLQTPNAYLLAYQIKRGDLTYLLTYTIKNNYAFRNQYIQNKFNTELAFIRDGVISQGQLDNMEPVSDLNGRTLFYIQCFAFTPQTPVWLIVLISALIIGILLCIHALARIYIRSHFLVTTAFYFVFWGVARWINTFYHLPDFIYELKLFNPVVYASSAWLPSLGDLLADSLLILWYFVILESARWKRNESAWNRQVLRSVIWFLLSIGSAHLAIISIKSLIIDSQISFDLSNVFNNDHFIYLCLITIIVQLLVVYFVVRNFTRSLKTFRKYGRIKLLFYVALGTLCYAAVANQFVDVTLFQLFITLLLFYLFLFFKSVNIRQNRFQQYFIVIFIIAVISALSIHHWVRMREHQNRILYATTLLSRNDITTDYFLRSVEKKINNDPYVKDYFVIPFTLKSQFEKRIRQIYFTGYLSKYEVNVLDYDSSGYDLRQRNSYSYKKINDLYNNHTVSTINYNFRFIKSSEEVNGYIAKFVIRSGREVQGVLFILLKPKLIQDENRFDDLLIEGFRLSKKHDFDYSYAVYKDKFLIYQSGSFPYRTNNTWGESIGAFQFFSENGFEHLLHTDDQPLTVVVSRPNDTLLEMIGVFSFLFTCCTVLLILILFIHVALNSYTAGKYRWLYRYVVKPFRFAFNKIMLIQRPETLLISTRIQTSIIFILFLTLLFTSYFTINFVTRQYNERQTERLMKKLRNVVLTVENENLRTLDWNQSSELEAFINQIADFYGTDIILYDKKGQVKASSISKIYEEGIVGRVMPPLAYYHLNPLRESQFTQDENIATLHFQAAYAPVFKNKSEVLGYLQLPYFSQKADLQEEISSIVVGFINLYVLLFIIIGLIAFLISRNISYPLTLIQHKLSKTVLLAKNEPIVWQRDDEIGELVKQYNTMISLLDESAMKLAEREREGAWREIARQIAHEIKNPLTPMKLSIQHLQRAFKNNDPNIESKIDRTTQLLITQIDTLSELATEFSSFAKMPLPVYEHINAAEIVRQIRDLYSLNNNLEISFEADEDCEMHFDASYLNRITGNLVKNAIQAIPEDRPGKVDIRVKRDNENIVISVMDNGKGMTAAEAGKIFMPYFSTKVSGIGLGLPIVKSMVESGKGTIAFTTTAGEGTTFTVTLPVNG